MQAFFLSNIIGEIISSALPSPSDSDIPLPPLAFRTRVCLPPPSHKQGGYAMRSIAPQLYVHMRIPLALVFVQDDDGRTKRQWRTVRTCNSMKKNYRNERLGKSPLGFHIYHILWCTFVSLENHCTFDIPKTSALVPNTFTCRTCQSNYAHVCLIWWCSIETRGSCHALSPTHISHMRCP